MIIMYTSTSKCSPDKSIIGLAQGCNLLGHVIIKPRLHRDSDPDPDPDWWRLHGGKLDSNQDSDHLSRVACDPIQNPDSGPGARVNAPMRIVSWDARP